MAAKLGGGFEEGFLLNFGLASCNTVRVNHRRRTAVPALATTGACETSTAKAALDSLSNWYVLENNGLVKRDLLRWKEVNVNTSKRQVVEYEEIDGDNKEKKPKLETLNLNTSKRQVVEYEEIDGDNKEKKPKLETLNLSLALELMVRLIVNLGRLEMGLQCKITVVEVFHRCKSLSPSRPSQGIQELPDEALEPMKKYLKKLIATPERKEELVNLQNKLEGRSYLNKETLLTTSIKHLEILVSVKTGLGSFLSGENCIPTTELVEIFLLERCRNINCKRVLPIDDYTCIWVGCDVCSHWCHAACGVQGNLIKPGPSLDGPSGTTEMQFHCLGCGHASEMFGEIFRGSEDYKGKKLHVMADRMLSELESPILTLNSLSLNTSVPNTSSSNGRRALHQSDTFLMGDNVIEDDMWAAVLSKEYGFDNLESFVRFKEAEARMYQPRADKARRESENYSRMVQMESDRLEEEYAKKLTKLCVQETEEIAEKKTRAA
ncbi:class I heat shock protein, putative [Actinidia rufa]|uniref:Class I heat shock protein, putative n=1 Tax=Actinidia rufa TaxID=165716 RepID=A0A7J0DCM7_9ERIC|nr:class I heat shock protein, putative [Actinidia rufa]